MASKDTNAYRWVEIGTPEIMAPMVMPEGGFGVYPPKALRFYTNQEHDEVLKTWISCLPLPSMQYPWFFNMVNQISTGSNIRASNLQGPPSNGKTTLGQVVAQMLGADTVMINCGNRSISELAKETTVDGKTVGSIYAEIETRLVNGNIHPASRRTLEAALIKNALLLPASSIVDATAPVEIDAEATPEKQDIYLRTASGTVTGINWEAVNVENDVRAAFAQVAQDEQVVSAGAGGIGFTTRNGELLEALVKAGLARAEDESVEAFEARPKKPLVVIFDEFSRRRDDGGALQQFYEVIGGTRAGCIVEGGLGKKYHIDRQTLVDTGSYFMFTSNTKTVGEPEVKPLPEALQSRLPTTVIGAATALDFEHRFQQILFGTESLKYSVPITALYQAQQKRWEADTSGGALFSSHLSQVLELGLDEKARARIPAANISFLNNWDKVMKGSQRVSEFFTIWRELVDADSVLRQQNGMQDVNNELMKMSDDATAAGALTQVDLRLLQLLVTTSLNDRSVEPIPAERLKDYKASASKDKEEEFGDRLVQNLVRLVHQRYPKDSKTRQFLDARMLRLGIAEERDFADTATLEAVKTEAETKLHADVRRTSNMVPLRELLNTQPYRALSAEHTELQEALVAYLKAAYPDTPETPGITADAPTDKVVPLQIVGDLFELWKEKGESSGKSASIVENDTRYMAAEFPVIDISLKQGGSKGFSHEARVKKAVLTNFTDAIAGKGKDEFYALNVENFIASLGMPGGVRSIIPHLWQGADKVVQGESVVDFDAEPAAGILGGTSASGLSYCALAMDRVTDRDKMVGGIIAADDDAKGLCVAPMEILHCFRLVTEEETTVVMVGDHAISRKQAQSLKMQGLHYYCRTDPQTVKELASRLDTLTTVGNDQAIKRNQDHCKQTNKSFFKSDVHFKEFLQRAFRQTNSPSVELSEKVWTEKGLSGNELTAKLSLDQQVRTATDTLVKDTMTVAEMLTTSIEKDGVAKPSYITRTAIRGVVVGDETHILDEKALRDTVQKAIAKSKDVEKNVISR